MRCGEKGKEREKQGGRSEYIRKRMKCRELKGLP